jgi:hypothetical protein
MAGKVLFIEGEENTTNGNLRQGFEKLLLKKLNGKLPKIKMGGGKKGTLDKFLNNRLNGEHFLLVDLDQPDEKREEDIN